MPAPEIRIGDIVSRAREPETLYKVVGYERNSYESSQDMAEVVRVDQGDNGPVIGVPRYKWDYWTIRENNGGEPLPAE